MRPRGESISSFHKTYVGQTGRQKPQWTHLSIISVEGAWCSSNVRSAGSCCGEVVMKARGSWPDANITEGPRSLQTATIARMARNSLRISAHSVPLRYPLLFLFFL